MLADVVASHPLAADSYSYFWYPTIMDQAPCGVVDLVSENDRNTKLRVTLRVSDVAAAQENAEDDRNCRP